MILLGAATHVVVDNLSRVSILKGPPDSGWFIFSAVAAAAAAGATTWLAFITRSLAKATRDLAEETYDLAEETADQVTKTKEAIDQTERHHQQSLTPILFLQVSCSLSRGRDGNLYLKIMGGIKNVGSGPATDVYLYIKPSGYTTKRVFLGVFGPNGWSAVEREVSYGQTRQSGDDIPFHTLLQYETIFRTRAAMWQSSSTGLAKDIKVEQYIAPDTGSQETVERLIREQGFLDFTVG